MAESRIYIEYNSSANDLGYHVSLDGEDWKRLKIVNPNGLTIFNVQGKGPYKDLGMTELFFKAETRRSPRVRLRSEYPLQRLNFEWCCLAMENIESITGK